MDRSVKNIFKNFTRKASVFLNTLCSTVIVGIGFVAVFQIVKFQQHQLMCPLKEQK